MNKKLLYLNFNCFLNYYAHAQILQILKFNILHKLNNSHQMYYFTYSFNKLKLKNLYKTNL